jgi:DNA-directed RNA polymerase subunit L
VQAEGKEVTLENVLHELLSRTRIYLYYIYHSDLNFKQESSILRFFEYVLKERAFSLTHQVDTKEERGAFLAGIRPHLEQVSTLAEVVKEEWNSKESGPETK